MAEVIVINRKSGIPVRHIITISEPYDETAVRNWYYDNYHKLDGDEFIYCETSKARNEFIENLNKK